MPDIRIHDSLASRSDLSQQNRRHSKQKKQEEYGKILSNLLDLSVPNPAFSVENLPTKPLVSPVPNFQIYSIDV